MRLPDHLRLVQHPLYGRRKFLCDLRIKCRRQRVAHPQDFFLVACGQHPIEHPCPHSSAEKFQAGGLVGPSAIEAFITGIFSGLRKKLEDPNT